MTGDLGGAPTCPSAPADTAVLPFFPDRGARLRGNSYKPRCRKIKGSRHTWQHARMWDSGGERSEGQNGTSRRLALNIPGRCHSLPFRRSGRSSGHLVARARATWGAEATSAGPAGSRGTSLASILLQLSGKSGVRSCRSRAGVGPPFPMFRLRERLSLALGLWREEGKPWRRDAAGSAVGGHSERGRGAMARRVGRWPGRWDTPPGVGGILGVPPRARRGSPRLGSALVDAF